MAVGNPNPNAGPEVFAPGSSPDRGPANLQYPTSVRPGRGAVGAVDVEGDSVMGGSASKGGPLKTDSYSDTNSRLLLIIANLRHELASARDSMRDASAAIAHRPERAKFILNAAAQRVEEVL